MEKEVRAHEEGHKDQITEAVTPIIIKVNIDNKTVEFTDRAGKAILKAANAFTNSKQAANMSSS